MPTTVKEGTPVTLEDIYRIFAEQARVLKEAQEEAAKRQDEALAKERKEREAYQKEREAYEKAQKEARAKAQEEARKKHEAADEKYRKEREASDRRWEQRMERLDRQMGKVTSSFGEVIEHLVTPNVMKKFRKLGFTFNDSFRGHQIQDAVGKTRGEIDVEFHNGTDIMVVEVKAHPDRDDVGRLIKKMTILRELEKYPGKALYGALAAAVITDEVRDLAIGHGFYVLEQSGDTMRILPADTAFKPKQW